MAQRYFSGSVSITQPLGSFIGFHLKVKRNKDNNQVRSSESQVVLVRPRGSMKNLGWHPISTKCVRCSEYRGSLRVLEGYRLSSGSDVD